MRFIKAGIGALERTLMKQDYTRGELDSSLERI